MSDFKERLKTELQELTERLEKATSFIESDKFKEILDKNQQLLLKKQVYHMAQYAIIITQRLTLLDGGQVNTTKGEDLIGDFNSNIPEVFFIKYLSANLVDLIDDILPDGRRKSIAFTKIEEAQMIAVKEYFSSEK